MGCVESKPKVSATACLDHPSNNFASSPQNKCIPSNAEKNNGNKPVGGSESRRRGSSRRTHLLRLRPENLSKYIEGEQVAAGWPDWLSAVAGEAIHGWVPLKADSFEKMEKIGQGTYSSVYRARDLDTGRIVALKKVHFDNFDPESVRFMVREIEILRRVDHPNIMKLEGLITSNLSCSIYLVFEYMEHDLAGLSSCPDIKFSESQVKCFMLQLLSGLDHCHSLGIMHRDIKGSNLLVNNEGILKIADFGLANYFNPRQRQPLTSRVVTLWYRPPELLLGSTNYGVSVDLWSAGCVFAELLYGKPILQGRTEIEQLHKIFKLCGSPPDKYWKKSKLANATIFKPQQPYNSCLQETFRNFPATALRLIETLLSIEPYKRGTASSALNCEYFSTKPYACDPSFFPKYPPNKEMDAKIREEARRKQVSDKESGSKVARRRRVQKAPQEENYHFKLDLKKPQSYNVQGSHKAINTRCNGLKKNLEMVHCSDQLRPTTNPTDEASRVQNSSIEVLSIPGPLVPSSTAFAWVKEPVVDKATSPSLHISYSRGLVSGYDPSSISQRTHISNGGARIDSMTKHRMVKHWGMFERTDPLEGSDRYCSQDLSRGLYQRDELPTKQIFLDKGEKMVEFSGPLLSQPNNVEKILERNERHIREAVRRSWFQRVAGKSLRSTSQGKFEDS